MMHYWNMEKMVKCGLVVVLVMACPVLAKAMQWPDTGQDKCYNNDQVIPCPTSDSADFHGQDAQFQNPARSYTKLAADGSELPSSATDWIMVRDNVTNLIWEIKTNKDSTTDFTNPHDADNYYEWCDSTIEHTGTCDTTDYDTEEFLTALNTAAFGGYTDWRLPTVQELASLLYIGAPPLVDWSYFPGTYSYNNNAHFYWSSTIAIDDSYCRWGVSFSSGKIWGTDLPYTTTSNGHQVRAVRGGQ